MANNVFTAGDLVISIYGAGAPGDTTTYGDNQATPITLEDISTSGVVGGTLVLPQTTTTVNGVTQSVISGEYGSSSEGTLMLSADGKSLTIAGYGVNAATYNQGGAAVYGNAALAQSTSVQGGSYTAVPRVIADIRADGTVDTSTSLYNVENTNNPRSVATVDGSSFYLSGQGVKGDKTQGLFYVQDGATTATAINNSTDTRTVEIYNGNVYVSTDSKQKTGTNSYTSNISEYSGQPTSAATPTVLPGISQSVTLTTAQANSVNGSQVGKSVALSPENYFFANATTVYVADGGIPKGTGLGDGGLQKWTYSASTSQWTLQYTLSAGLNLVANTATSGTTGLIGLTGKVVGDNVELYATNATIGDTDPTFLYGINDSLSATTPASGQSFTQLAAAAADTNIRGVAFAPSATVCYGTGTLIWTARGNVAVEDLVVGDRAITSSGAHRPIVWIGQRTIDCAGRADVLPVRVRRGAFGRALPSSDLQLSPGHAVCLDVLGEILMPIGQLVNGATILQEEVETVTYWHVELETHDILIANGMPAESYMDTGNRAFFATGSGSPDRKPGSLADYCRPFVDDPVAVAAVRTRLLERARQLGWMVDATRDNDLHLVADGVVVRPDILDGLARFVVPADAIDVWLVSSTFVPKAVAMNVDTRTLGIRMNAITIDDGLTAPVALSAGDASFCVGFHGPETDANGTWRWTTGRARLPASLWAGRRGAFFLKVAFQPGLLPAWTRIAGVEDEIVAPARPRLRLVEAAA